MQTPSNFFPIFSSFSPSSSLSIGNWHPKHIATLVPDLSSNSFLYCFPSVFFFFLNICLFSFFFIFHNFSFNFIIFFICLYFLFIVIYYYYLLLYIYIYIFFFFFIILKSLINQAEYIYFFL